MRAIPDGHLDRVAALVGRGRRVLLIEQADPRLAVRLSQAGCQVVALGVGRRYVDRFAPFCERVVGDGVGEADPALVSGFDAALAVPPSDDVRAPDRLIARVRPLLQPDGVIVLLALGLQREGPAGGALAPVRQPDARRPVEPPDDVSAATAGGMARHWSLAATVDALAAGGYLVAAVEWLPGPIGDERPGEPAQPSSRALDALIGAVPVGETPPAVGRVVARLACEVADLRLALSQRTVASTEQQDLPPPGAPPASRVAASTPMDEATAQDEYPDVVRRVRELILRVIPTRSTVLVVTRGDADLLRLGSRTGWHFPRAASGDWAGYYPSTSLDAIDHVEELRSLGAQYLVFPQPSAWWLEHYTGLTRHLDASYLRLHAATDAIIYQLFNAGVSS